jgi:hypothetical protein
VLGATLRVDKGSFYIELETREAGVAELVTSNGRERRSFRDPGQALKVVRELGVANGRFALEEWDTHAPRSKAWSRPDQAKHMKAKHQRAEEAAEFEADVLRALAEADNPSIEKIPHSDVATLLEAKIAEIGKKSKRKARV